MGPVDQDHRDDPTYQVTSFSFDGVGLRPYSPVQLAGFLVHHLVNRRFLPAAVRPPKSRRPT